MSEVLIFPKNWDEMQHYRDRRPAWIKLHRSLLDSYEFHCLPLASKALAPCIWLLASEYEEGKIASTLKEMSFRLRMTENDLVKAINPLIEAEFLYVEHDASKLLAVGLPREEREKRERERREREKEEKRGGFSAPSVEEVKGYAAEKELADHAQDFCDFYGSKGWMVGSNKMKDWKLAYGRWCRNQKPGKFNAVAVNDPTANSQRFQYKDEDAAS